MEKYFINQRVNVKQILTGKELFNGYIKEINREYIKVLTDSNTTYSNWCNFSFGGTFYLSAYIITPIN